MPITTTHQQDTALFVAAFFDEMVRWGVCEVVVSPGSRSTALAMAAYELEQRRPQDLRVYVDIDERGAAFLGLGLAKASGRPVALVCTSGTALANYYPAVIEAETSRVPLIVLSGDRPPQLQGLGAPQTTDQLKAYGNHVRSFRAMPTPRGRDRDIAFARQAAREAVLAALGPTATLAPYRA
ncbi:MAG: thiamine pyrophosphate-binding protein, partial [Adlercreutzia sp.]|nr:thiamine pyrophosphate-binding protein [Adlercreutzia sp.]